MLLPMSMESTGTLGAPIGVNRNARVAHIRKWVCNPPERGHVLRLVSIEDPPSVLGEWPRAVCIDNAATAEDVDVLVREHANTLATEIQANLIWQAEEGHVVCTKRLRCRPDSSGDTSSIAQAEAAGLDGSFKAEAIQRQREHEAAMRSYFQGHQVQQTQAVQLMREQREASTAIQREQREMMLLLGNMLKEQYQATHQAQLAQDKLRAEQRRELDRATEAMRDALESAAAVDGGEESSARTDLIKMVAGALGQAVPFIVQQVGKMMLDQPAANVNAGPAPTDAQVAE